MLQFSQVFPTFVSSYQLRLLDDNQVELYNMDTKNHKVFKVQASYLPKGLGIVFPPVNGDFGISINHLTLNYYVLELHLDLDKGELIPSSFVSYGFNKEGSYVEYSKYPLLKYNEYKQDEERCYELFKNNNMLTSSSIYSFLFRQHQDILQLFREQLKYATVGTYKNITNRYKRLKIGIMGSCLGSVLCHHILERYNQDVSTNIDEVDVLILVNKVKDRHYDCTVLSYRGNWCQVIEHLLDQLEPIVTNTETRYVTEQRNIRFDTRVELSGTIV